jgi:hypothetical protein
MTILSPQPLPSDYDVERQLDEASRYAREAFASTSNRNRPASAPPSQRRDVWGSKVESDETQRSFEFQHALLSLLDGAKRPPEGRTNGPNSQGQARPSSSAGSECSIPMPPKGKSKTAPAPIQSCLAMFISVPERKPYTIPKRSQAPPQPQAAQDAPARRDQPRALRKQKTFDSWEEYEQTLTPVVLEEVVAELRQAKEEADPPVAAHTVYFTYVYVACDHACVFTVTQTYDTDGILHIHTHTHTYIRRRSHIA